MKTFKDLESLLYPKSIAVVGATENPLRVGARVIENTKRIGFKGRIFPVNPKYKELFGYKCYPTLSEIPEPVDNVWIVLPSESVIPSLEEAEGKGIKVATVYSSGWGEIGESGKSKEKELKNWLSCHRIRLLGPNTIGMGNAYSKVISGFNSAMSFFQFDNPGDIGFVSQSGAMVGGMIGRAEDTGIGIGYYVHTGNEMDIDMNDVIEFMINDDKIRVILGYLEGVRDANRFNEVAELARKADKPLIFYKTGVSDKGRVAVASHTGAISGSDRVYSSVFRRWGITRVANHEDLFAVGSLFSKFMKSKPVNKGRLLVFTPSGGAASIFADKCEEVGIELSTMRQETKEKLSRILPPYTAPANPLDIGGGVFSDPGIAEKCLDAVCQDPDVDVLTWTLVGPPRNPLTARMIQDFMNVSARYNKPTVVHTLAGHLNDEGFKVFAGTNYPTFDSIESCTRAIKSYLSYRNFAADYLAGAPSDDSVSLPSSASYEEAKQFVEELSKGTVSEQQGKKLFSIYGISVPRGGLARSVEEAVDIAVSIGYPVVMKVSSPDIAHKTEANVVVVGVEREDTLRRAYREILKNATTYKPDSTTEGVLVEEMAAGGIETIVGMTRDPQFGPVIMFGLGGVIVEVLKDVSIRVVPFDRKEACDMVREIKAFKLLAGFRGRPESDIDAIVDVIMKVQQISMDWKSWISEIDINPLVVFQRGKGVKALDALVRIG